MYTNHCSGCCLGGIRTLAGAALTYLLTLEGRPTALYPFVLGWEPISEATSLRGGKPDRYLLEPVTAAAIEYESGGWVLLDTGFNIEIVRDPHRRGAHFNYESYTAVVPPGDPLAESIAAAGLDWSKLAACAISHLHLDHSGGIRLVPAGTPILIQRKEWEFATERALLSHCYFREDYADRGSDVLLLDGDTVLAGGLEALETPGHTPGHQSFRIDLGARTIVLAFDAADLRVNITDRRPPGTVDAEDAVSALASVERLAGLDALPEVEVWPGHDPDWWAWRSGQVIRREIPVTSRLHKETF